MTFSSAERVGSRLNDWKMKPTCAAAQLRQLGVLELRGIDAGDRHRPAARPVEPGEEVHQRRLARARGAHDRDELAARHLDAHGAQCVDRGLTRAEAALQVAAADHDVVSEGPVAVALGLLQQARHRAQPLVSGSSRVGTLDQSVASAPFRDRYGSCRLREVRSGTVARMPKGPQLRIALLGPPLIEVDGRPLDVDTRKATALLAYLAFTGRPARRDSLAGLLWPETNPDRARATLRRTLSTLKSALGSRWLEIERDTVALSGPGIWFDIDELRRLVATTESHGHAANETCSRCLEPLQQAAALDRGPFLAGFGLRDSAAFDDWQQLAGDEVHREVAAVLDRLAGALAASGNPTQAIACARRRLALDPLHEPAHRQLIGLLAEVGDRQAAMEQYRDCVRVLDRELGVRPLDETTALYHAIVEGSLAAPSPPAALAAKLASGGCAVRPRGPRRGASRAARDLRRPRSRRSGRRPRRRGGNRQDAPRRGAARPRHGARADGARGAVLRGGARPRLRRRARARTRCRRGRTAVRRRPLVGCRGSAARARARRAGGAAARQRSGPGALLRGRRGAPASQRRPGAGGALRRRRALGGRVVARAARLPRASAQRAAAAPCGELAAGGGGAGSSRAAARRRRATHGPRERDRARSAVGRGRRAARRVDGPERRPRRAALSRERWPARSSSSSTWTRSHAETTSPTGRFRSACAIFSSDASPASASCRSRCSPPRPCSGGRSTRTPCVPRAAAPTRRSFSPSRSSSPAACSSRDPTVRSTSGTSRRAISSARG